MPQASRTPYLRRKRAIKMLCMRASRIAHARRRGTIITAPVELNSPGCAWSDRSPAQRARSLRQLTYDLGSPSARWCNTTPSCHRSIRLPNWSNLHHSHKAWMKLLAEASSLGSPSSHCRSTTPSCLRTSPPANSNTRPRSRTAWTTSPRSPCAYWHSTSLSCPQTTPLPNSNTQPRSRTARTAGPEEAGPQALAVAGAVPPRAPAAGAAGAAPQVRAAGAVAEGAAAA